MTKICPRCNEKNDDFAVICINCGERIELVTQQNSALNNSIVKDNKDRYVPPEIALSKHSIEFDKNMLILIILWIVVLLLVISTLFLPWYSYNANVSGGGVYLGTASSGSNEYYLTGVKHGWSYSDLTNDASSYTIVEYPNNSELKQPMNIVFYLTIICVILAVVITFLIFLLFLKKIKKTLVVIFFLLLIITSIITLAYFTVTFPGALGKENLPKYDSNFIGSFSDSVSFSDIYGQYAQYVPQASIDINLSWGPSYGWVLILTSFVLSIISLIFVIRVDNKK